MRDGVYAVRFSSGLGIGCGIIVAKNGLLHGGDGAFVYRGDFTVRDGRLSATVQVFAHQSFVPSVVGGLSSYTLGLTGELSGDSFVLSGHPVGKPELGFRCTGHRVVELLQGPLSQAPSTDALGQGPLDPAPGGGPS